jgi:histidine triad (HIT) family protein
MNEKTIFEKIIDKEIPSYTVYEDENTYAFLDINPNNPGHTLVIPKKPYVNIFDIPEDILKDVIVTVKKLSPVVKEVVKADGIKLIMNNGEAAGQVVFHAHIHIIPRFDNDNWPSKYKEGEAEEIAKQIQSLI